VRALLLSTYELGHQPLHVAGPAGALQRAGHDVRCVDLSVDTLRPEDVQWAHAVAVSVPMHTAMRLARQACAHIRTLRPDLAVCFYGLYAGLDDGAHGAHVADMAIAGEYEPGLLAWFGDPSEQRRRVQVGPTVVHLGRQRFGLPARKSLPPLERYSRLLMGSESRMAGYVEASHGCAHRCRHCPVPVVYNGRTRLVEVESVLADVAQLVGMGAEHLTFGDPDFLNGPHHARRVIDAVHQAFPDLTFDITAKVEHILAHPEIWPAMAGAGCLFVVSAFESANDDVLRRLDKGHTVAEEIEAVKVLRSAGIEPRPSLLPFTPWTTAGDLLDLLDLVAHCDLIGNVDPVQFTIRLLVPPGSLLLDSGDLDGLLGPYDPEHLGWEWTSTDGRLDVLQQRLVALAQLADAESWDDMAAYRAVRAEAWRLLDIHDRAEAPPQSDPDLRSQIAPDERPRLSEAWFCCAEPTSAQLDSARLQAHPAPTPTGGR